MLKPTLVPMIALSLGLAVVACEPAEEPPPAEEEPAPPPPDSWQPMPEEAVARFLLDPTARDIVARYFMARVAEPTP